MSEVLADLSERFGRFFLDSWPVKLAGAFLLWAFGPWKEAYGVLVALVVLDTLTGIWASLREGRSVRSGIMKVKSLGKLFLYFAALLLAALVDKGLGLGAVDLTLGLLIATEALSVLENLQRIAPAHPLWERLRGLIRR
ncbi:phage holin family protein [Thermus sp. SYSU G05001]|uniref:Phage holin family protein n=1 Tax=Thermus brevis TaxID=2862456 RepID=A0ABS6ZZU4_9DEIN|nr:phage holin family protein [Thermus brevis]MBW6395553.1 phage holin family protein [Thermus brevis]